MMYKRLVILMVIAVCFGFAFNSYGETKKSKVIEWKAQTLFPPADTGTVVQAQGIVKLTNKALEGKLHTTLYQAGQLAPEAVMSDALSRGVLDAALTVPLIRSQAGTVAFGMPFGWENIDQMMEFYYDYGFLDFMRKIDKKKNVFFAAPMPFGPVVLFTKFPVNKIEDMKGKKIWAEGPTAAIVKALGAEPVWFDPGEIYMGLKLGTVDGIYFSLAELETSKLKEVVKYVIFPAPIDPLVEDWIINLESWNELTPETQQIYEKTLKDNIVGFYNEVAIRDQKGLEAAKKYGVQVITLQGEELKKFKTACSSVWDHVASSDKQSAQAVKLLKDYLSSKGITK